MDKVVHFEIPYDNEGRAKKFYESVFGWQTMKMPEMEYSMVTTVPSDPQTMRPKEVGGINGGMMKRDPTSKGPVLVMGVDNIDARLKAIEKAGGKIVMPKFAMGDYGYYARVSDPEGNVVGVWQEKKK